MDKMEHNLDREKKLLELLGYNLIGPNGSNRWIIVDENEQQVGYIQYKKLYGGNTKKGHPKEFGYVTYIDSPTVHYEYSRKLNDKEDSNGYGYSFEIKRDNQTADHAEVSVGDFSSLLLWSGEYGFIDFRVDYRGLFLSFRSQTEHFNIEEVLVYKNIDDEYHEDKEYAYQIKYCAKDSGFSLDDHRGNRTREISGIQYYDFPDQLTIVERTWVDGKLMSEALRNIEGTVEKMAIDNSIGIDCFNVFRFLINQIVPFKGDVISGIVSDDIIKERNLTIFFNDKQDEKEYKKVNG